MSWELSGLGIVRDGNCPVGIVRDGNCPVGTVRDGNCPGWELSGMGTVHPGGNCPEWELSGMGIVRIPPNRISEITCIPSIVTLLTRSTTDPVYQMKVERK